MWLLRFANTGHINFLYQALHLHHDAKTNQALFWNINCYISQSWDCVLLQSSSELLIPYPKFFLSQKRAAHTLPKVFFMVVASCSYHIPNIFQRSGELLIPYPKYFSWQQRAAHTLSKVFFMVVASCSYLIQSIFHGSSELLIPNLHYSSSTSSYFNEIQQEANW